MQGLGLGLGKWMWTGWRGVGCGVGKGGMNGGWWRWCGREAEVGLRDVSFRHNEMAVTKVQLSKQTR